MPNKVKKRHLLDYSIFIPYLILSIVGLIMVYSSTSALQVMKGFSPTSFVINQVAFWVVGLVAMFFIYKMKTSVFQNRSFIMFAIAVITVMVLAVRIPGIGKEINGARGWIEIGGFSMQPAEYLKIMVVWYLSYILARRQKTINGGMDQFKQVFSMSILFYAIAKLRSHNDAQFFLLTTIAGFFHSTSFIGYAFYFFRLKGKKKPVLKAIMLVCILVATLYPDALFSQLSKLFGEGAYSMYFSGRFYDRVIIAAEMLRRSRLRCCGVPRCAATR